MSVNYPFRDSTLPVNERISDLLSRLTEDEKIGMLSSHMQAVERLGIGEWFVGCEVARGFVGREDDEVSTVLPQPIGMASMFDPELMYKLGEIAGDEARYYYQKDKNGKLMVWGPTVDMERDPRWGRTEEAYGEDPFLTGEMTKAYTKGLAGEHEFYLKTVPTLKHFCADNNEFERGSCSANVDPRLLHEYYYAAFKPAITEGGAKSIMAAYNELSGVPAVMNPDMQKLLKDEWGLDFVVTDGGDFSQNVLSHEYTATHAEALKLCLENGADSMTDGADIVSAAAHDALERGLITMGHIEKAVGNVLLGRLRLGEFDDVHPYKDMDVTPDSDYARELNRKAAFEQVCLLKNDSLLPIKKDTKIALIGPLADENYKDWYTGANSYNVSVKAGLEAEFGAQNITYDNGYDVVSIKSIANDKYLSVDSDDFSVKACADTNADISTHYEFYDWDFGSINFKSMKNNKFVTQDSVYTATMDTTYSWFIREWFKPTIYDGLYSFKLPLNKEYDIYVNENAELTSKAAVGGVTPEKQFRIDTVDSGIERAVKLAKNSEVAVVCVGNHPMQVARECYDRPDIVLPAKQQELIKAVYAANPNMVLVIVSSYPYAINWENENVPSIIYTSHAGAELGNAVAKALSGENNPAARCPMTWYKSIHELPSIMDYDIIANDITYQYYKGTPIYPFGHGLSYSEFLYANTDVAVDDIAETVHITLDIANTSDYDGDEVVQVYYRAEDTEIKRPLRKLCGFKRVHIKHGETVNVQIDVPYKTLEFYDVSREKLCTSTGDYTFMIGASSLDIRTEKRVHIIAEDIPARNLDVMIKAKNYDEKDNCKLDFSTSYNDHFVIGGDWGGTLVYLNSDFKGYKYMNVIACNGGGVQNFTVSAGNEKLGEAVINPSPSLFSFTEYKISLENYIGTEKLVISIGSFVSVYGFWFE